MENQQKNKECTFCHNIFTATKEFFRKDIWKKDNLSSRCKICLNKQTALKRSKKIPCKKEVKKLTQEDLELKIMRSNESKRKDLLRKKKYRDKNREKINENARKNRREGKIKPVSPERRKLYKKREYEKLKADPYKKLKHYFRVRVNNLITRNKTDIKHKGILLFNREDFINHIENQFDESMTWENYGREGWHIDHIRPLNSFNLKIEQEFIEAWSLTNLQPLWAKDNLQKGSKYDKDGLDKSHTKRGKLVNEKASTNRARQGAGGRSKLK